MFRSLNDKCLEHFCRSGKEIPERQCSQERRTDQSENRLTDYSEHILVFFEIDSILAADCGIDLCKQSRGHKGKTNSPFVDGSCKPSHISGYSSSNRKHKSIPVSPFFKQPGTDFHHSLHCLGFLGSLDIFHSPGIQGRQDSSLTTQSDLSLKSLVDNHEYVVIRLEIHLAFTDKDCPGY